MNRRTVAGKIIALFATILLINMLLILSISFYQANRISSQEYDQEFADIAVRFKMLSETTDISRMTSMIEPFNQMSTAQITILHDDELTNNHPFISNTNFERLLKNPTRATTVTQDSKRYVMALYGLPHSSDSESSAYLIIKREVPQFTVEAIQILQYALLAIVIVSLPTLFFLFIFLRRYSKPIVQMSRVAEQIAEGKWDERVQVNSKDEIGQLATSLNHMAVKIAENEKSRDAFLAGISHELRTPLTTLKANTTAMLDGIIQPEEVHTYLHSNVEEIDRLTLMVNDLILVSTLEQDPALHIERTNVHDLFQSVLLTMRLSLEKKSLGLVIDMPNQLWIDADKFKLKQVFINVIYNAIQHSPQGGNLFIEILPNKHYLRILITDQGPGFSSDSIPHLFKRFYRDQYSSGLGLGLYISQIIIRAHHGKMKAYNSNHGGACIEIEFPMK